MIQFIKLALRKQTATAKRRGKAPHVYDDSYAATVLAAIEEYPGRAQLRTLAKVNEAGAVACDDGGVSRSAVSS